MKYKRLLIISGSILAFVALCVTLCFTLFRTHSIVLNFHNETTIFADEANHLEIVNSAKIDTRMPIFSLNKTNIRNALEKNNPYLKVINIETAFPNKLIVHCAEREELFCIDAGNELYYICDEDLKILNITRTVGFLQGNALALEGITVLNTGASTGDEVDLYQGENVLKVLSNAFAHSNKNASDIKGMFKSLSLVYEYNFYTCKMSPTFVLTTYDDFKINIRNAESFLATKLNLMLAIVPQKPEYYSTHSLVIDINPSNINEQYIAFEQNS